MAHKKNKMKDELKALLSFNGRRLDWVASQFGLSRRWFDIRVNLRNFSPDEWAIITDLIFKGQASEHFSAERAKTFIAKKHNNR